MSEKGTVQQRRRAETVREIKQEALAQLVAGTGGELSLRRVAREVGMSVQALYHYFASRDELLTVLVREAHDDLADAVQARVDDTAVGSGLSRRLAAACAYRDWAIANRASFLLIYGNPVSGFEPVREGRTSVAAFRLAVPFVAAVFDGWTPDELESIVALRPEPPPPDSATTLPLPWGALCLLIEQRALMHGLVMLELFGYYPLDHAGDAIFNAAMQRVSDDVDERLARIRATRV